MSSGTCWFIEMIRAPTKNWMIMEEVTMGEMPSSIKVPLLEARMTLTQ